MRNPLRPSPRLALAPLSAGLLLLAACGGGGDSGSKVASLGTVPGAATETTVSSGDTQEQWLKFAQCMRDNGVDMQDPTFDADGNLQGGFGPGTGIDPRDESTRTALTACRDLMPAGGPGGGGNGAQFDRTAIQESLNNFTACLRDQGLDVDDVDFAAGPGGGGPGGPPADGSIPTPPAGGGGGFQGGPPPDGAGSGTGGFDPTARILDQLGLDSTDPKVTAAVDACSAQLAGAFPTRGGNTTDTTVATS